MDNQDNPSGSVGYGKPPRHGQFKPGKSGNPRGRPKGSKNLNTILHKELNTRVPVTENGRHKLISKGEAIVKQTVNKAISGDHKAAQMVLNEARQSEDQILAGSGRAADIPVAPEDQLVIDSIVRRIRLGSPNPSLPESAAPEHVTQPDTKVTEPEGDDD